MNIPEVAQAVVEVAGSEGASTTIGILFVRRARACLDSSCHESAGSELLQRSWFELVLDLRCRGKHSAQKVRFYVSRVLKPVFVCVVLSAQSCSWKLSSLDM